MVRSGDQGQRERGGYHGGVEQIHQHFGGRKNSDGKLARAMRYGFTVSQLAAGAFSPRRLHYRLYEDPN